MITLYLRYTIDPNKLADFATYTANEQLPIRECGGKILGYFLPTDFAGATNEAIGLIDFPSLAEYEIYRARLAAHPLHKQNVSILESTYWKANAPVLLIQRSLIRQIEAN